MYLVTIEPDHRLMRIRVDGFWTVAMMADYVIELRRNVDALAEYGGCARILIDMSDYPIQSQPIAQAHARIIHHGKTVMKARTAVVMKSALSRMQAIRVARLDAHELFEDEASARRWLLAA